MYQSTPSMRNIEPPTKSKMATKGPQYGRQGLERGPILYMIREIQLLSHNLRATHFFCHLVCIMMGIGMAMDRVNKE